MLSSGSCFSESSSATAIGAVLHSASVVLSIALDRCPSFGLEPLLGSETSSCVRVVWICSASPPRGILTPAFCPWVWEMCGLQVGFCNVGEDADGGGVFVFPQGACKRIQLARDIIDVPKLHW